MKYRTTNIESFFFKVDDGVIPGSPPEGNDAGRDDEEGGPEVEEVFPHERLRLLEDLVLAGLRQRSVVQLETVEDAFAAFVRKTFLTRFSQFFLVAVDNLNHAYVQL